MPNQPIPPEDLPDVLIARHLMHRIDRHDGNVPVSKTQNRGGFALRDCEVCHWGLSIAYWPKGIVDDNGILHWPQGLPEPIIHHRFDCPLREADDA